LAINRELIRHNRESARNRSGEADTVTDFSNFETGTNHDTISLASSEFANFAAVLSGASNSGCGVLIGAADGDTLTSQNLNTTTLAGLPADFAFHA
jgi:hypothetical protein